MLQKEVYLFTLVSSNTKQIERVYLKMATASNTLNTNMGAKIQVIY